MKFDEKEYAKLYNRTMKEINAVLYQFAQKFFDMIEDEKSQPQGNKT